MIALGVVAMAGDAVFGEDLASRFDSFGTAFGGQRPRQRAHIDDDIADLLAVEDAVSAECHHLRDTGVVMGGVDADADRLLDRLGLAAPQPGLCGKVRKTRAAGGVDAVTGGAIVVEQRASGLLGR